MFLQFIKYNLVGILNTIIGFSIIFFLMFIGISPIMSNFIAYAIASIFSYYLNSRYTFRATNHKASQIIKFFMVVAFSYLLNLFTLQLLLDRMNPYLAQFISAIVYTLSSFLLVKFTVFKNNNKEKQL